MFVSIEGIDGAGKTALAKAIAARMSDVSYLSKKQPADDDPVVKSVLSQLAEIIWNSPDGHQLGTDFWISVHAAWYAGLSYRYIEPHRRSRCLVVDGWFYKYLGKVSLVGYDVSDLLNRFCAASRPDVVILLDVDPAVVWDRSDRRFLPRELGWYTGDYPVLGRSSFIAYQARIYGVLDMLGDLLGWHRFVVNAATSVEELVALAAPEMFSGR